MDNFAQCTLVACKTNNLMTLLIYKDEGKELEAVPWPAETTEIVETSDDRDEAVEKSEMPETTDLEAT